MTLRSENKLINAIAFQAIWWATVLLQGKVTPIVLFLVILHLVGLKDGWKQELKLIVLVTITGSLADTLFSNLGFLSFQSAASSNTGLIPFWLISLWMAFSCTINHSLSWVYKKPFIAFVVGALAGPLSYYGAANLGVIKIGQPLHISFLAMAVFWGLLFFILSLAKTHKKK